jgi:hypothetical protein
MSLKSSYVLQPTVVRFADVDIKDEAVVTQWTAPHSGVATFTVTFQTTDVACQAEGIIALLSFEPNPQAPELIGSTVASIVSVDARSGSASFAADVVSGVKYEMRLNAGAAAAVDASGILVISYL